MTKATVDALFDGVLRIGLALSCPGAAIFAWVMVWRFLRRNDPSSDNVENWTIFAVVLTIAATVVVFATWYANLPGGVQ